MVDFVTSEKLAFPQGSMILVTGVSGMIAVHIADEALKAGFRVRGTVRSVKKGKKVEQILQSSNFQYLVVEDLVADAALDEAVKGVSAIIHSASTHTFSRNIEQVLPAEIQANTNVLEAALANPSVRSVVFTSSIGAASDPRPGVKFHINRDSWNDDVVDLVRGTPAARQAEMGFEWTAHVHRATKTEAERAVWTFVRKRTPPFAVNVVAPGITFGKAKGSLGVSGLQVLNVLDGNIPPIPSLYMVDIVDNARIHVAAAIDSTLSNERIFACDEPFNWRLVIEAMQNVLPDAQLPQPDPDEPLDISTIDNKLGANLLRKFWRQSNYKGLQQTIRETVELCLQQRNGVYKRHQEAQEPASI